jgi:hypothetical protein
MRATNRRLLTAILRMERACFGVPPGRDTLVRFVATLLKLALMGLRALALLKRDFVAGKLRRRWNNV